MEPDEGGDPACWVHRVCPECGRLAERPGPQCAACGARLPGADEDGADEDGADEDGDDED